MKTLSAENAPLLRLAICLIAGIVVGEYVSLPMPLLPLFVGVVAVALLLWKWPRGQSVAIAVCFVVLGALLMERQKSQSRVQWPDGEVQYEAVVLSDPIEKPKTMAVDILLLKNQRKLKCYLYKDERSMGLRIGDGLRIQSHIQPNSEWRIGTLTSSSLLTLGNSSKLDCSRLIAAFDYRRYLEIHGFTGTTFVSSWKWQKVQISLKDLSRLERTKLRFLQLRSRMLSRLRAGELSGDQYAVVAAMVLGDKSALTKELKETYSVTGASHVLALSGLHLGIIYALLSLLVVGRRWQMVSQLLIISSIWAFVFLVGMPVSVVRSAVMLSIYALLSLGHRNKMSVNTLAFTAIVLLMVNPQSLFDVGFQMSFVAVFSILIFLPLFDGVFSPEYLQSHRIVKWVWGMVAVSCSAQIGVAPLIAYYFGRFSTYFLLTNFIVIPAATLILYLSLLVLIVPASMYLLIYITGLLNHILTAIARIPGASIEGLHPSPLQVAMVYVVMVALYLLILRLRRVVSPAQG